MTPPPPEAASEVSIRISGMSKTFGGHRALQDFALDLQPGEVHALVGENGCGKSTLIKCLSGYQSPDPGAELLVRGERMSFPYTAAQAADRGLVFVHQNLGIVPSLSVMENVALGGGFATRRGRIRWKEQAARASAALGLLGRADIAPDTVAGDLPAGAQAIVAIARALGSAQGGASLVVLDEPTAALPQAETEALFDAVRTLAEGGAAVLFVSHRLQEVFMLADRVTVLRDGRVVGTHQIADLDERGLVNEIVGRELAALYPESVAEVRDAVSLQVEGLSGAAVHGVSFSAHRGEILGIAGLQGSGRSELLRLLFGAQHRTAGEVRLHGRPVRLRSPASGIAAGVALVPEDRIRHGIVGTMSVGENVTLATLSTYWRRGRLRRRAERARVGELIDRYDVRPRDPAQLMVRLSGGNQQKGVLAKWLETEPTLLLLDEPVQGVDVGSKSDIYHLLESWVERTGATVVMVSSDFEDLRAVCHRVLVMRAGRIVGDLEGSRKTLDRMLELAYLSDAA
jgi:ABC-type sugar transport system ATPase subunit